MDRIELFPMLGHELQSIGLKERIPAVPWHGPVVHAGNVETGPLVALRAAPGSAKQIQQPELTHDRRCSWVVCLFRPPSMA